MEENYGVEDGQGRTPAEVAASVGPIAALCLAFIGIVAAVVVSMLSGCATTYHGHAEDPDKLHPNRPSAKELRPTSPF